jgi:asparagine synthase (glutamine-hydrolysing)
MTFVVLPDGPAATEIRGRLPESWDGKVLEHPSGRPWIVGRWSDADVVWAASSHVRVAILGTAAVAADALAARLRGVRTIDDLDSLARSIPGSFHLIGSVDGRVRAQGSISTARQIFYGKVMGVTVAADRPQILGQLTGSGVNAEQVALHLLTPFGAPWPLNEASLWKGVRALTPGHYLQVSPDGVGHTTAWWTPPDPDISLAAGATLVREALEAAVEARNSRAETISSDFSGGMDSTSLCFLAARNTDRFITVHYEALGGFNDDKSWMERCKGDLPQAHHVMIPRGTSPALYDPISAAEIDVEGPLPLARPLARMEHQLRLVAKLGSTRHMQGTGGDELFMASTTCLHTLSRQSPWRAVRHIRSTRSRYRWNLAITARQLSALKPYPRWLDRTADQLSGLRAWGYEAGWEIPSRMPPWATGDAIQTAHRMIREAAAKNPSPFSPLPVQHNIIRSVQAGGWITRGFSRLAEQLGVSLEAPYLDDRVLEAALSIRLEDRMSATHMKPVLAAAMRGVVPHVIDRTTKADASPDLYDGIRRNRRALWEMFEDSYLARMGLIDPESMRGVLFEEHADARPFMPFDTTLGVELWLRSIAARSLTGAAR